MNPRCRYSEQEIIKRISSWCLKNTTASLSTEIEADTLFFEVDERWEHRLILWREINPFVKEHIGVSDLYPDELNARLTIRQLAKQLTSTPLETEQPPHSDHFPENKIKDPTLFILGVPRSGTTLFRTLLTGHPLLNAPPELHLLGYNTMKARERKIVDAGPMWKLYGLAQTLAEQLNMSIGEAFIYVSNLTYRDIPIHKLYQLIHSTSSKPILIDKTPSYIRNINIIASAERIFEEPKYIHLVRHPCAVTDSMMRLKEADVLFQNLDTFHDMENMWLERNRTAIAFLETIPGKRKFLIRYEDLIQNTEQKMHELCNFIGINFSEAMLTPYSGNRLIDGIGDPNLKTRNNVDHTLVDAWRARVDTRHLSDDSRELAIHFGYQL
ncbi:hypothetical protein BOW53_00385 [Solemya pervernicosa gill symbiont]|uniref:Sulfotransferase family protein n=1 Tax=Solemya pervernicosa gill symbiont TaxID=642797 RepID=A0A1T2LBF4_9GAMM|nr:sulfotransferase [Solemya pervernicosa gill symbiont]OOZ42332.1 hypothetical protein BOW53_00385 [Solemya pervernicosa gill symbiont]